jgi:iron complex outermembrane receptor protein
MGCLTMIPNHKVFFWVNIPDLVSSVSSLQIQRGVGLSTPGAGAFGGAINLITQDYTPEPYAELNLAAGSFDTFKGTLKLGSGLIKDHWIFNARLSSLSSNGYMDRSGTDLLSYYVSGGYFSKKTTVKLISFGAHEITHQAWNGVPSVRLENDTAGMLDYAANSGWGPLKTENLLHSDRRYNYYTWQNEIDDYTQLNNQVLLNHAFTSNLSLQTTLHYTRGYGYFEQYQYEENAFDDNTFAAYGIDNPVIGGDTITTSDFIRQRWLDNHFAGIVAHLNFQNERWKWWLGGAFNQYQGKHFGDVIWSSIATTYDVPHRYYENSAIKTEYSFFGQARYTLNEQFTLFGDIQYRGIQYEFEGLDEQGRSTDQLVNLNFINPKVGLVYNLTPKNQLLGSFAIGNKEPNRDDYVISTPNQRPLHQTLYDTELGYRRMGAKASFEAIFYWMSYENQLVQTGEINDVGEEIRTNVASSFRRGIELVLNWKPSSRLQWQLNATFSQNKIQDYVEFIDNWDTGLKDMLRIEESDLAFSPGVLAGSQLSFQILKPKGVERRKSLEVTLLSKYVGDQFLDNTSSSDRMIDAYFVNDLRINFTCENGFFKQMELIGMIRNLFDTEYVANGWVYKFNTENETNKLDGLFPQARINFLLGVNLSF